MQEDGSQLSSTNDFERSLINSDSKHYKPNMWQYNNNNISCFGGCQVASDMNTSQTNKLLIFTYKFQN